MIRKIGTDRTGGSFDSTTVSAVWSKAQIVQGQDANVFRKDSCGAWIQRSEYGNTASDFGWEVDHIQPVAAGGTDSLSNLQPLHWKNNRHKGDEWPKWQCAVRAS